MSKTETLRQLSDAANATRVERLASQIESLRQAKHQSAEDLAATLEPLAQAMAALADETRQTLAEIDRKSREQGETFKRQLSESVKGCKDAAAAASQAAESLNQAGRRMEWRHYLLAALVGMLTAAAVTASWLWLAPPTIQNQITLDAQAVAEHLKAATAPAKPSKSK
ncbi:MULTISPECIES: IncQ-type mobilization protein MobB [unclassified Aeromonas]|jgi:chromosome segregation ATPase|uniref:IncQ-type mobilization protein MobB n=1 Tax=unclassified Aeromonas TaxID=257493 RepID=UPI0022E09EF8|nr:MULTISPECIES: IncQ-type mobilization protein MobB [unclassified Aeromonas]